MTARSIKEKGETQMNKQRTGKTAGRRVLAALPEVNNFRGLQLQLQEMQRAQHPPLASAGMALNCTKPHTDTQKYKRKG